MQQFLFLSHALVEMARYAVQRFWSICLARSHGQGLVEYGLILVLIMVFCVSIVALMGQTISEVWYEKLVQAWP
ncbi:MAG: hypothetical protein MI924_31335 [Chloroflexales bacterium]|nr:hypothetical protein [Chloroflexales bacterium]